MAESAPATGKKRKPQGPRVEKPVFAFISAKDDQGNVIVLNRDNVTVTLERDPAKIVELVTGSNTGGLCVVRATMPASTPRAKPATA